MKVCIIAPGAFKPLDSDQPVIGQIYHLEPTMTGTEAQNKAFHALLGEYWKSGCSSHQAKDFDQFRDIIKRDLGEGFESYFYVDLDEAGKPRAFKVGTKEEIPDYIRKSPDFSKMAYGKLKSWSDYTKKQRRETMDKLISEMHQTGVQSNKFTEILSGLEGMWK